MDKILSINTIKNVFSALGAKTSDSNYAVALLDKTSAEPKGFMDMSSLASVLGAVKTGSGDANTIDDEWHMCSNNVSNVPTPYGLLHTKKYSDALFMQEYFSTVDKQSYTRTYYSGQWHDWTSLNSFGCSTPADLASLLGGSLFPRDIKTGKIGGPSADPVESCKSYWESMSGNSIAFLFVEGSNNSYALIVHISWSSVKSGIIKLCRLATGTTESYIRKYGQNEWTSFTY